MRMGSRGKWFNAVKKALVPQCCQAEYGKSLGKSKHLGSVVSRKSMTTAEDNALLLPPFEEVKLTTKEGEQSKHDYSVALASAFAAEAAAVAARAAAEVVRLTAAATRFSGKSREEIAAIKIQTAFRSYLARRSLRALRGLARLRRVVDGIAAKSQTTKTLLCTRTMARTQTPMQLKNRMKEDSHDLKRHQQRKCEDELEKGKVRMHFIYLTFNMIHVAHPFLQTGFSLPFYTQIAANHGFQSKEKADANLLNKKEGALRRERALAYAFSHQLNNSSKSLTSMFQDPSNPQLGWNWLARWMERTPWDDESTTSKEIKDHASPMKSAQSQSFKHSESTSERTPSTAEKSSHPSSRQSPATTRSSASSVASRKQFVSPRGGRCSFDGEPRSTRSVQYERRRRHSIGGLPTRDLDNLASSPAVPNYMASTQSARARSRLHSEAPEKGSTSSVRKHLSPPGMDKKNAAFPQRTRRLSLSGP
ncbi:protein IQ-DOMAIN 1-like [Canna indica]|uniref:Protein IQ-DOMAIN 1-like n=1 Tax=Canna indica TaxID=4628 RepID=A0AAQ3QQQ7_9LILI|nr:protein IQ-DOMAIN 1-like [Canna indica]